jgi:uncharacterized protein YcbK (DUF882 family)
MFRLVAALLALSLVFAGQGFFALADNPMGGKGDTYVADPQAQDDEPVTEAPAPPASAPIASPKLPPVGSAAPAVQPGKVMQPVSNLPLPPRRPFSEQVMQPPPQAAPPQAASPPVEAKPEEKAKPEEEASESEMPPSEAQRATPDEIEAEEQKAPEPMLVEKQTDAVNIACLKPELMSIIRKAGEHFGGTPVITSGQRSRGRRGSYHRKCMAADFIIAGVERARLAKYLRALPDAGGVGTYCHTKSVHIDIGEPRNWYQCGFRFRFSQR